MRRFFFILGIICIAGCTNPSKSGSTIIPKQQMAGVLWDMIQVDEFTNMYLATDTSKNLKTERLKLYTQVFKLHKVSEKDFFLSYKHYSANPELMKELFDTLTIRGEREKNKTYLPKDSQP